MKFLLLAFVAIIATVTGAPAEAICPVLGINITDISSAPALTFDNGQKLYFASEDAVSAYTANPRAYWLSPFELPLPGTFARETWMA